MAEERLTLSIPEAARAWGISKNLAYTLARAGNLPGVIHLGPKRMVVSKAIFERTLNGEQPDGQPAD